MAEGGGDLLSLSIQKLDEELTCPVCHEHFEEPKVLPCLHCYCKKCVAALIERADKEGQPMNCPECRRDVQVADNDPGSLPTAFLINRIEGVFRVMTKAEATEGMKCENCSELPSVAFCQQCGEYICEFCVKAHKRMWRQFSSHEVVSIASLRTSIKKSGIASVPIKAQELKCHKHKDEPLKLYCYTCHVLVCRDCTLIDHKDHKYAFIVDAAPQCKSTIEKKAELLQNVLPALKMVVKLLAESEEMLLAHHTTTVQAIDNTHNRIGSKLQQKIKELKAAATQNVDTTQEEITTGKKNAELAVAEVTSLYEFLNHNLERATDQELFSLLKQMSDQAERAAQLYADPPVMFPVPTLPQLEVHCSEDVLQVLQDDVYIADNAIPNRVQKKGTVHELTDQLEKMQQKMAESEAAWRQDIEEKEAAMVELTTEKEDLRKEFAERDQELTDQMEKMQQKMAESEAAWRKSIGEKEAAMAELTSEKEDLRKEIEQLRKSTTRGSKSRPVNRGVEYKYQATETDKDKQLPGRSIHDRQAPIMLQFHTATQSLGTSRHQMTELPMSTSSQPQNQEDPEHGRAVETAPVRRQPVKQLLERVGAVVIIADGIVPDDEGAHDYRPTPVSSAPLPVSSAPLPVSSAPLPDRRRRCHSRPAQYPTLVPVNTLLTTHRE